MTSTRRSFVGQALLAPAFASWPPRRRSAGREYRLAATEVGYNEQTPGPEIRAREGELVRVTLENRLPAPTTIHWHGLPVENRMDGVPGPATPPTPPGGAFVYEFVARPAGTYFYHSHAGLQLDQGLFGPLIIEPAGSEEGYDREFTLLADDWLGREPEAALAELRQAGGGMMMGGAGGDGGPTYSRYLLHPAGPLEVRLGDRVRLRLINAASATTFRFAVGGHRFWVTHVDGRPVVPVLVDAVLLGVGERYDLRIEATAAGVWPVALAVADTGRVAATTELRYRGSPGEATGAPEGLRSGRLLRYADLASAEPSEGLAARPDRVLNLTLSGSMGRYLWAINGELFPNARPLEVRRGERVRMRFTNMSPMRHPMHLHGHFFRLAATAGGSVAPPSKDTVIVPGPMGSLEWEFTADNPGDWMLHCHQIYHMEAGMARMVTIRG